MKRLLPFLLAVFYAHFASAAVIVAGGPVFFGTGGGGGGAGAIITEQTWKSTQKVDGTGSVATLTLNSQPSANRLINCYVHTGDGSGAVTAVTMGDTIGDANGWNSYSVNPVEHTGSVGIDHIRGWGFWKVVGTPSGGGMNVTATISGTQYIALFCAVAYVASGTPTWTLDGTATSATGTLPSATQWSSGSITTSSSSSWVTGFSGNNNSTPRGYTTGGWTDYLESMSQTGWWLTNVTDRITTTPSGYDPTFTGGGTGDLWFAIGAAFKAN